MVDVRGTLQDQARETYLVPQVIEKLWIVEMSVCTKHSPYCVEFPTLITSHLMPTKCLSLEF